MTGEKCTGAVGIISWPLLRELERCVGVCSHVFAAISYPSSWTHAVVDSEWSAAPSGDAASPATRTGTAGGAVGGPVGIPAWIRNPCFSLRVGPRLVQGTSSGEFSVIDGAGARETIRVHLELGQADPRMTHGKAYEAHLASIALHVLPASAASSAVPDFDYIEGSIPRQPQMAYAKSVFASIEVECAVRWDDVTLMLVFAVVTGAWRLYCRAFVTGRTCVRDRSFCVVRGHRERLSNNSWRGHGRCCAGGGRRGAFKSLCAW